MKKILGIVVLGLLLSSVVFGETYKTGQEVEGQIVFSKKVKIDLPEGKWTIAARQLWNYHGLNLEEYSLVKIEDKEFMEGITVGQFQLAGIVEGRINSALYEILFKDKYDGCYERPEYFLIEFYAKGNTHNCFWVLHEDVDKELNNPDDPTLRGSNRLLKKWFEENSIILPKITLSSDHSYFSRLTGGTWFVVGYYANPKFFNAPINKFYTEESSEYHKFNIEKFPEHKKVMQKWISISAERHKQFEENVKVRNSNKLDLSNYYSANIKPKNNKNKLSSEVITQIKQLNDLYKTGVLTKDEFTKAKKKLLK
ncbi:SHOCT domain-containing protein [Candidatus Pelagibacter ubique]|nr:SHOCT domain-containing protein [Candidatus Pelagibacter ubique]